MEKNPTTTKTICFPINFKIWVNSFLTLTPILPLFGNFTFFIPYHCDTGTAFTKINVWHKIDSYLLFFVNQFKCMYMYFRFLRRRRFTRFSALSCSAQSNEGQNITARIKLLTARRGRRINLVYVFSCLSQSKYFTEALRIKFKT